MTIEPLETKTPAFEVYQQIYKELKLNPRTVQWYATEGYIPKPEKIGTEAYYSLDAQIASRIRAIQALQKRYALKLKEIKIIVDKQAGSDWDEVYNILVAVEELFPYTDIDEDGDEYVTVKGSGIADLLCARLKEEPVNNIQLADLEEKFEQKRIAAKESPF